MRIGSQADPDFLASVVEEMGGVDIVLDDGSHVMEHIKSSLPALLPKVSAGGIYMIEDLHTAYWHRWGGGYKSEHNFFNQIREMIDDMHCWYHTKKLRHPELAPHFTSMHVYDSICVLEKDAPRRPVHSKVQTVAGE